jgi:hypothetical protein
VGIVGDTVVVVQDMVLVDTDLVGMGLEEAVGHTWIAACLGLLEGHCSYLMRLQC